MKRVTLRWRAATVVLQGLLAMTFLISGISALSCHSANSVNHFTPNKGNTTVYVAAVGGIINCSSAQNVCTDAQLTLTIDKEVLMVIHKGCASKDLKNETEFITSGDRHFAIQFNESYCFDDLCNAKPEKREVPRTPIEDGAAEASGSNQCYAGFAWGPGETIQQTMTCSRGYNLCYNGTKSISVGPLFVSMIFRTCQRPACDVSESQSFGPINITSESGSCCSGSNCNEEEVGILNKGINPTAPVKIDYDVKNIANPNLFYDQDEDEDESDKLVRTEWLAPVPSGFQGYSLQLCPLLAALGATILGIWG
ncbi:ly6/PLAUR domain-containing protein 5-like isoform X1 [Podarcis muralis]